MKYRLMPALAVLLFTGQFAQAMPVSPMEIDAHVLLVRDGCGPGAHAGPDGFCHRDWDRDRRPPPPQREFYAPPPPRYFDDRYHRPRPCPPGFHLGRYSGVCRPNDDL